MKCWVGQSESFLLLYAYGGNKKEKAGGINLVKLLKRTANHGIQYFGTILFIVLIKKF